MPRTLTPVRSRLIAAFGSLAVVAASLVAVVASSAPPAAADVGPQAAWGGVGPANGTLSQPDGIATDSDAEVFVVDAGNDRIESFNRDAPHSVVQVIGGPGTGDGQFTTPSGIAVDQTTGDLFVTDSAQHEVTRFTNGGAFNGSWGFGPGDGVGQLSGPQDVAVNPIGGNVYVADTVNNRVVVYSPIGTELLTFGGFGSLLGQLSSPAGIGFQNNGRFFVADTGNNRVVVYDPDGLDPDELPDPVAEFGTPGSGTSQFNSPQDVDVDENNGSIFVVDRGNGRVQVFGPTFAFQQAFGTTGTGINDFSGPSGIAITNLEPAANKVFIADTQNNRVQRYSTAVAYESTMGVPNGSGPGQIRDPFGVAVGPTGKVYTADAENHRIQVANADGSNAVVHGSLGSGINQFNQPKGLATDGNGNLWVADAGNNRIVRCTLNVGLITGCPDAITNADDPGPGPITLNSPADVAVDATSTFLYVTDSGNSRVVKFNTSSQLPVDAIGSNGNTPGSFIVPLGIDVDPGGSIWVADTGNDRIQQFQDNGSFLSEFGTTGTGPGQFENPGDIGFDGVSSMYVVDTENNRVQEFSPGNVFKGSFGGLGVGSGQLSGPRAIAVNRATGQLFVADGLNARIQRFGQAGGLQPSSPLRILDTRTGTHPTLCPTCLPVQGAIPAQGVLTIDVLDNNAVPFAGVDAVVMNVTATGSPAAGWLTIYPAGEPLPNAANMNFGAGQTVPNLVVVKVGDGANEGKVSIENTDVPGGAVGGGPVHVIADIVGWYNDGSNQGDLGAGFVGVTPTRKLDTRIGNGPSCTTCLNIQGTVPAQGFITLDLDDSDPVPLTATAVVLNVTATGPAAGGWLTVYPADQALPNAASLNFVAGQTVPNLVTVKLGGGGSAGQIRIENTDVPPPGASGGGPVHVIADVVGYYRAGITTVNDVQQLSSKAPVRIRDTRTTIGGPAGAISPNGEMTINPSLIPGLLPPGGYDGVVVNITVTGPTLAGWITAFPSDVTVPNAANLNFLAGQTVQNLVKVKVGPDGTFKVANTKVPGGSQAPSGTVHVIIDLVGYFQE